MRCTEEVDTPDAFAIERVLQCVASARLRLQRPRDRPRDRVVADLARRAAPGLVVEAVQAMFGEAPTPRANGLARDAHSIRNCTVVQPFCGEQHDLGPLRIPA